MQIKNLVALLFLCCLSCKNTKTDIKQEKFDKAKWAALSGTEYPYREQMLKDLVESYTLKGMKKEEVLEMLGQPNKTENGYLFFTVSRKYVGNTLWPLSTKTLVIKLTKDSTVEWRKIHG